MLTKSDLQSFLQCPRKLWLEHHKQEMATASDSSGRRRMFDGNIVAEMARRQLGVGFLWPQGADNKLTAAQEAQKSLQENPGVPAAEFPMVHLDLYARADAIIPTGAHLTLRETKASSFPLKKDKVTPDKAEEHHLDDAAIQAWVMKGSNLPIGRVELNLLNSVWRYPGNDDYTGLFRQMDVTDEISGRLAQVSSWLDDATNVVANAMPDVSTGRHCTSPYSCSFQEFCNQLEPAGPEHPIELLPDKAGKSLAHKLRETKGYSSILDPVPDELTGTQSQLYRRIQEAHRSGQGILQEGAEAILGTLLYPRYYFDFEGIDLPVPHWAGVRPYEQIPFQWSCHIERAPGKFDHAEFLDLSGNDPSLGCIENLLKVIYPDDGGPIFVYYATYERSRLAELALRHPEFSKPLQKYIDRLFDLHPLVKAHYYHPDMRGSFSIKKVLPVIAPDLDYEALGEIQEGTGAQVAYIEAALDNTTSVERKSEIEHKLRIYCRQDTWAMVEVAYFLAGGIRPIRNSGI